MKPNMTVVVLGQRLLLLIVFLVIVFLIIGCGNENQGRQSIHPPIGKFTSMTILEGAVTDNQGPIKGGTVTALDSRGQAIASVTLENNDHYRVQIPADTELPIVLSYSSDDTQAEVKKYLTAVVHANLTQYDINPLSTAIAKKAKELGGYTHANLVLAAEGMGTVPDSNKMTSGFRGDPTKQYGGWH
jgi:hypothetical protein